MACFFATRTVFLSRAWEARLTPSNPPYSEKSTPLLHMSKILTGAIDAYFCRGNGLVSKRQTFWQSTRMEAPLHHGSCY
jgi:hypothetical protein